MILTLLFAVLVTLLLRLLAPGSTTPVPIQVDRDEPRRDGSAEDDCD
jgi:hypothetical protein